MKDNPTQELPVTADGAEAQQDGAATELGKFKDVKALMDAYTALEAEFTRRSQRLKELEANKETHPPAVAASEGAPSQAEQAGVTPALTEEVKNAVIAEYINGVRLNRGVPILTGGGAVAAQRRVPATVREAGMMAKNFFNNQEEN